MVNYKGKNIIITGGTGFIGGRLAERLVLEEHANVKVLVRNWCKAVWVSRACVDLVYGDITDATTLTDVFENCDVVFHCAATGGSREACAATNVEGARNVMNAALNAGVKQIVHLSSIAVHGPLPPDNADENDDFRKHGKPFGDSAIEAEEIIWELYKGKQLPVAVIRPTFVWGPKSSLFTIRQAAGIKTGQWTLVDQGRGSCHAVYVDNLVDAIMLAGSKKEAVGEAFIITDNVDCTWKDFFNYYQELLNVKDLPSIDSQAIAVKAASRAIDFLDVWLIKLSPNPAPIWRKIVRRLMAIARRYLARKGMYNSWDLAKYSRRGRLNTSKARTLLGYKPRISLTEGMKESTIWLQDQLGEELGLG